MKLVTWYVCDQRHRYSELLNNCIVVLLHGPSAWLSAVNGRALSPEEVVAAGHHAGRDDKRE